MKKHRIVYIIYLLFLINSLTYSQISRSVMIEILTEYQILNDSLMNNPNANNREKVERYAEECLHPILFDIQSLVCDNQDGELLTKYISTLLKIKNSADEIPITTFGSIYICEPTMTLDVVMQPEFLSEQSYLFNILEFGFMNAIADMKEFDYQELFNRIKISRYDK